MISDNPYGYMRPGEDEPPVSRLGHALTLCWSIVLWSVVVLVPALMSAVVIWKVVIGQ